METYDHTHKSFFIKGCGKSKADAALEFMDELEKHFPKKKGYYDMTFRLPLVYELTKNPEGDNHMYFMRGTWNMIASLEIPADATQLDMTKINEPT